jgi:hypothetical protein
MVAKRRLIASLGGIINCSIDTKNGCKTANCFRHLSFYVSGIATFGASQT